MALPLRPQRRLHAAEVRIAVHGDSCHVIERVHASPAAHWPANQGGALNPQQVELGLGPSGLTARIAELPHREEDIVAARTAEHRHNMQTTLEGLKAAAEQGR